MGLDISFASKELRDICENEAKANEAYGELCSKVLFSRLADLKASETVCDVVAGAPEKISASEISINLDKDFKLIITANHTLNPLLDNAEVNWDRVSRIKITSIKGVTS